jgi:hypothetical protein
LRDRETELSYSHAKESKIQDTLEKTRISGSDMFSSPVPNKDLGMSPGAVRVGEGKRQPSPFVKKTPQQK